MKNFKALFLVIFLPIFFFSKDIFLMPPGLPGMEDSMGDFPPPESMPVSPETSSVQQPAPVPQQPVPVPQQPVPVPQQPVPVAQQPAPVTQQPVPVQVNASPPAPMLPQPQQVAPIQTQTQQIPPVSPVLVVPPSPPVTESQKPLIQINGKQISLSESTGPLVKDSKVQEMQVILDQANLVMQDIKKILNDIENIGKEFETKFADIDKQLDSLYQTIGFERGVQTEKLSAG